MAFARGHAFLAAHRAHQRVGVLFRGLPIVRRHPAGEERPDPRERREEDPRGDRADEAEGPRTGEEPAERAAEGSGSRAATSGSCVVASWKAPSILSGSSTTSAERTLRPTARGGVPKNQRPATS